MEKIADKIKEIIDKSGNIVVLSGLNVMKETGLNGVRAEHLAYETEEKYGYANDDIISSAFYARRSEIFYDYIKNVTINKETAEPTIVHKAVRQLQQKGKVPRIITYTVYGLYENAGCENVLDIHGSIQKNKCPACGKIFDMKYIKDSVGEPLCDTCKVPIRPGFLLLGERVDNGKMSEACDDIEAADVLLVLGFGIRESLCQHLHKYYKGNKLILVNTEEKLGDERADYRIYGKIGEIVPYITGYDPDAVFEETDEESEAAAAMEKDPAENS